MREIKFRVWNGSEMVHNVVSGAFGTYSAEVDQHDIDSISNTTRYPDDCPVMQYTGLKDKNGVEIYEGDVVAIRECISRGDGSYDDSIQVVCFMDGCWCCKLHNEERYTEVMAWLDDEFEVIGNIHEHPHLLEG